MGWCELHCFGNPTAQLVHQHVSFCTMWLDRAKGLFCVVAWILASPKIAHSRNTSCQKHLRHCHKTSPAGHRQNPRADQLLNCSIFWIGVKQLIKKITHLPFLLQTKIESKNRRTETKATNAAIPGAKLWTFLTNSSHDGQALLTEIEKVTKSTVDKMNKMKTVPTLVVTSRYIQEWSY